MSIAVPRMRVGYTAEFQLGGEPATLTATALPDGRLGEVTLRAGSHGSALAGMTDAFSTAVSVALLHGAPVGDLAAAMRDASGSASAIPDCLARCLTAEL